MDTAGNKVAMERHQNEGVGATTHTVDEMQMNLKKKKSWVSPVILKLSSWTCVS